MSPKVARPGEQRHGNGAAAAPGGAVPSATCLSSLAGRRVLVAGFGLSGRAVASVVRRSGGEAVVVDDRPGPELYEVASAAGVELRATPEGPKLATLLESCELLVPSPGIPAGHPVVAAAKSAGLPVWSEVELAARAAAELPAPPRLAAITGTNGKTTVTTLVAAILEASGRRVVAAGNIGSPLVDAVASGAEVVVAEVSSFQLLHTDTFRPAVSCFLNLAPDHLDWHPSLEHYVAAKSKIWANQGPRDTAVVNSEDPTVAAAAATVPPGVRVLRFSTTSEAEAWVEDGWLSVDGARLLRVEDLPRSFPHDVANALAAAAVALSAGATPEAASAALAHAPLLPHRVSLVGEGGGVSWYDDSKATTPASVKAAVAGFESVVLIAGGRNKGLDLSPLASTVPPVRAVVAIGESAAEVAAAFRGLVPVERAAEMAEAVEAAARLALPGDAVLLSPGCASFDAYSSYAERGDHFAALVLEHLGKGVRRC